MTEKEARAAIDKVCQFLESFDVQPDYDSPNYRDEPWAMPGERMSRNLANDFCRDLLEAARANGLGGCPLCQG